MNTPPFRLARVLVAALVLPWISLAQDADKPAKTAEKLVDAKPDGDAKPGELEIKIDTTDAPELEEYGKRIQKLAVEWYPKLCAMLPSDGYTPTQKITIIFKKGIQPPAMASGNRITCKVEWFTAHPEDVGAVIHELVHVIQAYKRPARDSGKIRAPGWLVEGIADYIRWYKYEPGKDRSRKDPNKAKYTDSYRTTAHFLNWATDKYDKDLVVKLNAACREAKYTDDLWKEYTGKTADELGTEWKATLGEKK